MTSESKAVIRCAIYTRKSSEEGLEQSFNSLDAQREACAAFIASQRHEGWRALPALYDDGGYSGGNLDRPALKHRSTIFKPTKSTPSWFTRSIGSPAAWPISPRSSKRWTPAEFLSYPLRSSSTPRLPWDD